MLRSQDSGLQLGACRGQEGSPPTLNFVEFYFVLLPFCRGVGGWGLAGVGQGAGWEVL